MKSITLGQAVSLFSYVCFLLHSDAEGENSADIKVLTNRVSGLNKSSLAVIPRIRHDCYHLAG